MRFCDFQVAAQPSGFLQVICKRICLRFVTETFTFQLKFVQFCDILCYCPPFILLSLVKLNHKYMNRFKRNNSFLSDVNTSGRTFFVRFSCDCSLEK
jgi:hypothetical protein